MNWLTQLKDFFWRAAAEERIGLCSEWRKAKGGELTPVQTPQLPLCTGQAACDKGIGGVPVLEIY